MAKESAFARMIGLTKSLSPLGFDRARSEPGGTAAEVVEEAGDAPIVAGEPGAAAMPAVAADAFPVAPSGAPVDRNAATSEAGAAEEKSSGAVVVDFPAVAKVTVVAAETTGDDGAVAASGAMEQLLASLPGGESAHPARTASGDGARDAITAEAISAIEADIAVLLSSLDREDLEEDAALPIDLLDDQEDDEAQVGELLSELDRLWKADPVVAAGRGF